CAQGWPAPFLHRSTVHATPRSGTRGRPRHRAPPAPMVSHIAGAVTSALTVRQARLDQPSCCSLATNELDDPQLSPQALLPSSKGQSQAERGFRFWQAPQFVASSCYLKKPARSLALLMVLPVCFLVYAALAYRSRHALKAPQAPLPDQKGKRVQTPTARWGFH